MSGRDDESQSITSKVTKLEVWIIGPAADETEMSLATFHAVQNLMCVCHRGPNFDVGIALAKYRQEIGEQMLAGHRAGSEFQLTGHGRLSSGKVAQSFAVKREDALSIGVQTMAGFGQNYVAPFPIEERQSDQFLDGLNALADGCLREAQRPRRRRKVAGLGGG